jgi:hypothetical protein
MKNGYLKKSEKQHYKLQGYFYLTLTNPIFLMKELGIGQCYIKKC